MNEAEVLEIEPVNRELDLSIGQRLAIGFGALLLVLLAFAIAVLIWHSQSADAQRDYTDRIAPVLHRADAVERGLLYVGVGMRSYLLVPEPQRLARYRSHVEQTRRALTQLSNAAVFPDGAPDIEEISTSARAYIEATERIVAKRRGTQITADEESELIALRERALDSVHALVDLQSTHTDQALSRMSDALEKASASLVAFAIVGSLLCLAIAWFTTQSIRRPAKALMRTAAALERGDWKPALHLAPSDEELRTSRSEMRRLANAIGSAAAALEQRERDLREKNETIQAQNEELRSQNDQIQSQNEELQAQNQQIHAQTEELQAQAVELQAQGEELQSQNEELSQQGNELRAQSDALFEANERKNHFLGVLAHELRNPLAPISNSIFILKRVPPGSDQAVRAQAVIERQTRHMIRLIDDLLDITRISQGKIRAQKESVDIAEAVRSCLEDQNTTIEQSGLHLSLDLPARPVRVYGDYTRICQVFGNLLSNAIKFTSTGGTVSVSLREDESRSQAVLEVQDTGVGLDPALMPQLFQPFSQGANAHSHTNSGLGLGLALVKALVEMHNGSVVASSAGSNKGSLFTVRLPLLLDDGRPAGLAHEREHEQ
jgi:signal transduction histidine kinase/CHASE3 domain sensor protein